jgi:hypothetical protein
VYGKEHDIDAIFHGIMTDAEKEKRIRELHEKAYGLDEVKNKYQRVRQRYEEVEPLTKKWNQLNGLMNQGDYHSFFKGLGISPEVIRTYSQQLAEYEQLTPEGKAAYDLGVNEHEQYLSLQQEMAELREQFAHSATQTRGQELDSELARPDVLAIVAKYDSAHGQGSFRNLVINTGESTWKTTGKDYGAGAVVNYLVGQLKPFLPQENGAVAQASSQIETVQGRPVVKQTSQAKPSLPNIQGQTTSPTRRIPRSIEDLKRIRKEKAAQDRQQVGDSYVAY